MPAPDPEKKATTHLGADDGVALSPSDFIIYRFSPFPLLFYLHTLR